MDLSTSHVWPGLTVADPYDEFVGPFPKPPFCDAWYEELGSGDTLTVGANATLPLVVHDGVGTIAGSPDVTDYHSPLGDDVQSLAHNLVEVIGDLKRVELDSMPVASVAALTASLASNGLDFEVESDGATAVLALESNDYLDQLSKKQRHETRRKRRRFVDVYGEPSLVVARGDDHAVGEFIDIHRKTDGDKGSFMTPEMEGFFRRLGKQAGWEIVELRTAGHLFASLFGYREADCYYLYNSGYDPEYREVSPGVVVLAELIQQLAKEGCMRFDFLKGDEVYKFRLGAAPRPLSKIVLQ